MRAYIYTQIHDNFYGRTHKTYSTHTSTQNTAHPDSTHTSHKTQHIHMKTPHTRQHKTQHTEHSTPVSNMPCDLWPRPALLVPLYWTKPDTLFACTNDLVAQDTMARKGDVEPRSLLHLHGCCLDLLLQYYSYCNLGYMICLSLKISLLL